MKPMIQLKRAARFAGWGMVLFLAGDPAAGAPPPELKVAEERLEKLRAERVDGPYEKEMARLAKGYLAALDREITKRQQAANLDEVVVFSDERKRVEEGRALAGDESTDPPLLKDLRRAWRESIAKPRQARDAELEKLLRQYEASLTKMEAELTKAGWVEDALEVRATRESVRTRLGNPAAAPVAPAAVVAGTPVAAPPMPEDLKAKPPAPRHTRELIAWALAQPEAKVSIRTEHGVRGLKNDPKNKEDDAVPEKEFSLSALNVEHFTDAGRSEFRPEWLLGETALEELRLDLPFRDFSVLRGMKGLRRLEFGHQSVVADEDLLRLPYLPELRWTAIAGPFGNAGIALLVDRVPKMESMSLEGDTITPAGLQSLMRAKNLAKLSVRGTGAVTAALTGLPPLKIHTLAISRVSQVPESAWKSFKVPAGVRDLEIFDGPLPAEALTGVDWSAARSMVFVYLHHLKDSPETNLRPLDAAPALKFIRLHDSPVTGRQLADTEFVSRMESIDVTGIDHWTDDDVIAVLRRATRLERFFCLGAGLTDGLAARLVEAQPRLTELRLGSPKLTDASTVPLKELRKLNYLDLGCPGLTPAGLSELARIRSLKSLDLEQGKLPPGEIELFRAEHPGLKVQAR